jgi:hypothetical protein
LSIIAAQQEFEAGLAALDRDSRESALYLYTFSAIYFVSDADHALLDRLNLHAAFWTSILAALQGSTFVALGRFFDERKDTHSAKGLLNFAEKSSGIFSRAALEARKVRAGLAPEAAKEFAAAAYELRPGGLAALQQELKDRRRFFEEKVKPIRHDVFAHAGKITKAERDRLFVTMPMRSLEDLVVYTLRLYNALFYLYHDGREPILGDAPSNIAQVMERLPDQFTTTWPHLHAAKDAATFLGWIKGTPLEE